MKHELATMLGVLVKGSSTNGLLPGNAIIWTNDGT